MNIILHGYLRDLYPREIRVEGSSAAEAISALKLIPEFDPRKGVRHSVVVRGFNSRDALYDKTDVAEIHLEPIMAGAGGGAGVFQIVLGSIMVAVGVVLNAVPGGSPLGVGLILSGLSLVLGGVLQLLAPQPKLGGDDDAENSQYLGQPRNTVAAGTHIPMIYGRRKAFGHYLSFNVDARDLNTSPAEWYASPFTDYGALTYAAVDPALTEPSPSVVDNEPVVRVQNFREVLDLPWNSYDQYRKYTTHLALNFTPSLPLELGEYDAVFSNGLVLRVECIDPNNGAATRVIVLGGAPAALPSPGTYLVFQKNGYAPYGQLTQLALDSLGEIAGETGTSTDAPILP